MTTATEPVQQSAQETTQTETAPDAGATTTPATQSAPSFNPDSLSADVKGYVERERKAAAEAAAKRYADYEQHVAASRQWEEVRNDPRFQKWAESLRRPEPPKAFEITDEQYQAAINGDKSAFAQLVQAAAKQLVDQTITPQLESTKQKQEFQDKVLELKDVVRQYPDFKDLDNRGLIEPIIRKYPNMTFDDAYWLAKKDTLNEEADRRARGIVEGKKKASVERPAGAPAAASGSKMRAKNREEAMNMVAEAIRAGRPVPEFEEIGD